MAIFDAATGFVIVLQIVGLAVLATAIIVGGVGIGLWWRRKRR